ncbi:hypothetical protein AX16_003370 [Volvariella volvacea WC 439]|nr:hypothetical protein AX16_003370 [Volvariella volvacea WC 439]
MFNGDDRDDAPKCHPETRKSIVGDIEPWAIGMDLETGILWLKGPVGTGKSAIARKVCEDLHKQNPRSLVGSFFFWRNDGNRNSLKAFVPTIAYRLSIVVPKIGELIRTALVNDPSILNHALEEQWDALIIKPLLETLPKIDFAQRSLIVVDSLDECEPHPSQLRLLRLLPTLEQHGLHHKIAVLIASRPGSRIQSEFDILTLARPSLFRLPHLMLSETGESREDMRLILTTSFSDIHRRRRQIIGDCQWSPDGTIDRIIDVANGQFIYVLTIVRWLSDEDGHPVHRLEAIFRAYDDQRARAFAPLDHLYTLISEAARKKEAGELVLPCLSLYTFSGRRPGEFWHQGSPITLSQILQKDYGYIRLILQPLHSVLSVPDQDSASIEIYHRSFSEYLHDQSRSNMHWVGEPKVVSLLLARTLALDYKHFGFTIEDQNLGMIWLALPLTSIEMTSDLVASLAATHAAEWVHECLKHGELELRPSYFQGQYRHFCDWLASCPLPLRKKGRILRNFRPDFHERRQRKWMWTLWVWWFLLWDP